VSEVYHIRLLFACISRQSCLNGCLGNLAISPTNVTCALAETKAGAVSTNCEDEVVVSSEAAPSVQEVQLPVVSCQLSDRGEWVTT